MMKPKRLFSKETAKGIQKDLRRGVKRAVDSDWLVRATSDVLDNIPSIGVAKTIEKKEDGPSALMERLVPPEIQRSLHERTKTIAPGQMLLARVLVNKQDKLSAHPHDFVIEAKNEEIHFYFIDPEHNVGKRHPIRPKVGNIVSYTLPRDKSTLPSLAIVRYRTGDLDDIQPLKLRPQLKEAQGLLAQEGLPTFLKGKEKEVLLRIVATESKTLVQSRYGTKDELTRFGKGEKGPHPLEARIASQHAILNRFVEYLDEGTFRPFMDSGS